MARPKARMVKRMRQCIVVFMSIATAVSCNVGGDEVEPSELPIATTFGVGARSDDGKMWIRRIDEFPRSFGLPAGLVSVSSNGTRIASVNTFLAPGPRVEIFDGQNRIVHTFDIPKEEFRVETISISPTGRWVVLSSPRRSGKGENELLSHLRLYDATSGELVTETDVQRLGHIKWSPTESRIVFTEVIKGEDTVTILTVPNLKVERRVSCDDNEEVVDWLNDRELLTFENWRGRSQTARIWFRFRKIDADEWEYIYKVEVASGRSATIDGSHGDSLVTLSVSFPEGLWGATYPSNRAFLFDGGERKLYQTDLKLTPGMAIFRLPTGGRNDAVGKNESMPPSSKIHLGGMSGERSRHARLATATLGWDVRGPVE